MLLKTTISQTAEVDPGLDQAQLFALGLEEIRTLSRRLWTDHNTHDPGITILELACYALTELSYRAHFPIEDLLATPAANSENMARQFFLPQDILPNGPLTAADYRKLLIDIEGIENAWISPVPLQYFADTVTGKLQHKGDPDKPEIRPIDIQGLYQVQLEFDTSDIAEQARLMSMALEVLHEHRNLCEDFDPDVKSVLEQLYTICTEIELTSNADPVEVAAQLFYQVERYFSPSIRRYSLPEMLERRHPDGSQYTLPEIFEGPLLKRGFIDDCELTEAELRREIRLSDVINLSMEIAGVRAVRNMIVAPLTPAGEPPNEPDLAGTPWRIRVPEGHRPRLVDLNNPAKRNGRLVLYKRSLPVHADFDKITARLQQLREAELALQNRVRETSLAPSIPLGTYRHLKGYYSIQNHFPAAYGLSEAGLPATADAKRRAQVLQLRGYLLFFDQVMANYFSQLANFRELLALDPTDHRTYSAQIVQGSTSGKDDLLKIYPNVQTTAGNTETTAELLQRKLTALLDDNSNSADRRSRFVDHLLVRCAEDFRHYVGIMQSAFGTSLQSVIAAKYAFLKDYPKRGGERGLAFNASSPAPAGQPIKRAISGLEYRLKRLLDIDDSQPRPPGRVRYDTAAEIEPLPDGTFQAQIKHLQSGELLVASVANHTHLKSAAVAAKQVITRGKDASAYRQRLIADSASISFDIVDRSNQVIASSERVFDSVESMRQAIDVLADYFTKHYNGEGLYLVENLLLRPRKPAPDAPLGLDPTFLDVCIDDGCDNCAELDPYSYRLHVVLPAEAGRFEQLEFRRFVEEVIRQEMPAQILPRICWVDGARMSRFEAAYQKWTSTPSTQLSDRQVARDELIEQLYASKNVFPDAFLQRCETSSEERPLFIVGRSHLGKNPELPQ